MTDQSVLEFLTAPGETRFRIALDPSHCQAVRQYLGDETYEQYAALAERGVRELGRGHLSTAPRNVIFVPGVTGSLLRSETLAGVWWLDMRTRTRIDDLRLSADGLSDANPEHQVVPFGIDWTYDPFLECMLRRPDFGHVYFPYDWRKSLLHSAARLRDKIHELYAANDRNPIHFVAHSMGGLLVRATLMEHGSSLWNKVGRIVFLGTPHYGSPAIASYLKDHLWGFDLMAVLGLYLSRATFRSLRGMLELLPAPVGIYPGTREATDPPNHPCATFDLYRADKWGLDLSETETAQLQDVLSSVRDFHSRLFAYHRKLEQRYLDRMAVIAGVGYKTLFRVTDRIRYTLPWHKQSVVECDRNSHDPHREGDGRVTVASACLESVGQVGFIRGRHGELHNISLVQDNVFRWLSGQAMSLPNSVETALAGHLGDAADQPIRPFVPLPSLDDPGYWQPPSRTEAELHEIDQGLAAGSGWEFNHVRLL